MYFEVNITPKEKSASASASAVVEVEAERKFSLTLAPFQPQTHVRLETELYTTAKCYLSLINPSNRSLNVQVSKKPPPERAVALNVSELRIGAQEEEELVISWTAREPGTWRDIIQLTDSRKIKYNVALTTKSSKRNDKFKIKDAFNNGAKKRVQSLKRSPKKKGESKRNFCENVLEDLNSPKKRHKSSPSSFSSSSSSSVSKYQGKENISNFADAVWQTPTSKKSNNVILGLKRERLSDFSMLIESDGFALSPHLWIKEELGEDSSRDSGQFTSQNYAAMLTSPKSLNKVLRRETYITTPGFSVDKNFTIEHDSRENFDDSLSPMDKNSMKNINFSNLINDINFATNSPPVGDPAKNIRCQPVTPKSNNNNTFEVLKSSEVEETSKTVNRLAPTRLAKSFARLSPVMPVTEPITTKFATSSSPICGNDIGQVSTNFKLSIEARQLDASGVQEVLEADLWAKPMNQFPSSLTRSGATSLESIREESLKLTPVTNKTYVKSSNETQTPKISSSISTANYRRFEFSPPNVKKKLKKVSPIKKISPKKLSKVSKDKSVHEIQALKRKAAMNNSLKSKGNVSINGLRITKLSLAGLSKRKCESGSSRSSEPEVSTKLHDTDNFLTILCNPDPFAATTTEDPFLASTLYFDDKWVDDQEIEFKKWLNALLTPPEHLTSNVDTPLIDVAKVWQTCRLKEDVSLAETKEAVSARYHTNQRLTTLRRAACSMLRSSEVVSVLSRVTVCVEKGILVIRQDRDLHKDIGLQKLVLELFLSYNPLWLRIGLEAIYGETIPLNSNNDIIRLTKFLLNRFFSDPYLVKTHSHNTVQNLRLATFFPVMNKFMLKKFLMIVYFLDYAKMHKLIGHDPCLFHKQSSYKESKRILLRFSQELLSGVGDVTRVLKPYGYILIHRQTEIDEYSYAVDNLSLDLRDGVRLCRVMELITGKRNLTSICRVPAISRLQKVYNVDVALKALTGSGYTVQGNITAKCIADGHREKTLSLLWQIIYKFQAPHFNKAASTIQRWWSSKILWVRVRNFLRDRRSNAARVIQRTWRSYLARKEFKRMREYRVKMMGVRNEAARMIQAKWIARAKMIRERRDFLRLKSAAFIVQKSWRNYRATKSFVESFNRKRKAALVIQRRWRAVESMRIESTSYLILKNATIRIQIWWRRILADKNSDRKRYREMNEAAFVIQNKWRDFKISKTLREDFLTKRKSAVKIQNWWRNLTITKRTERSYTNFRSAIIFIQRKYRAKISARVVREEFIHFRKNVLYVQRRWRANKSMKECRDKYLEKRNAVFKLQEWWRACLKRSEAESHYLKLKTATIYIQRKYRALRLGESVREEFQTLRSSVVFVQRKWRAKKYSQPIREKFLSKRKATVKIQTWWRASVLAKDIETYYKSLRYATIFIQRRYKAKKLASVAREDFLSLKKNVVYVQRRWRANKSMKECRDKYLEKRNAVFKLQEWWRACLKRSEAESHYLKLKTATIYIQRKYRALRLGESVREEFQTLRSSVVFVQRKWRAKKYSQPIREKFLSKRKATVKIQTWWRASVLAKDIETYYKSLRYATIFIQRRYKAKKLASVAREEFLSLKKNVIYVQRILRAKKMMIECRERFLEKRNAAVKIQRWWRDCLEAKKAKEFGERIREEFLTKRWATIKIQNWWRALMLTKRIETYYKNLRSSTILIQRKYRSKILSVAARAEFMNLRTSAKIIQERWRANRSMKLLRKDFLDKRRSAIKIQIWFRSVKVSRIVRDNYLNQRTASIKIQRWYRSVSKYRETLKNDRRLVESAITIQRRWREILTSRENIKARRASAATIIQAVWRAHKVRRIHSEETNRLRERSERAAMLLKSSDTLGLRLNDAILMFREYGNLGRLTQGLTALDTITHLLPHTSTALCNANLVGELYDVLHRSNRSRPWMDICLRASSILVTITKYTPTKQYAWREEHVETIVHLMTATIEREIGVFLHLATLLWLLADSPARVKAIAESPMTVWSLSSMYNSVSKKKTSRLSFGQKQPFNTTTTTTTSILPNPKPDWGLRHSRPRLFTTVHHAVYTLCKKLQIKYPQQ